jgi:type I restriction enzyme R subunit
MANNFIFLEDNFPQIAKLGSLAESYLYSDPNACLIKLGMMAEGLVNLMYELDRLEMPKDVSLSNKIRILNLDGMLPRNISDILYQLRIKRNVAAHEGYGTFETASVLLEMAWHLAVWFVQTYGDYSFEPQEFELPEDHSKDVNYEQLIKENEALAAKLETVSANIDSLTVSERKKRSDFAVGKLNLSEKETRMLIDAQLRQVGWTADTANLRYSKGTMPQKGVNLAIAEYPVDSKVAKTGYADYALFAGLELVGIIEAKAAYKDIPAVIDNQCRDYAKGIRTGETSRTYGPAKNKAPFVFATNGRPYLKQLETKSGIWFKDVRQESNIPRALQGWMSPQGMLDMLAQDVETARNELSDFTYDLLRDPDGLNLYEFQVDAIEAVEKKLAEGKQTVLVAMATGTGKTRIALGMIYRFLKVKRFRRILFLVDRNTLGEQAQDAFKEIKLEDLMTLNQIYNIKTIDDTEIDKETRIHVATVQSMVRRILYNADEAKPSVSDYDLVIVDEAHRGYILDREMGEEEQMYRNQSDFISKYRAVIEYFDAVKIALTATPALHTTQIFGKPVFEYPYRKAVIEGYLVDHDAPHAIKTKLSEGGIRFQKGERVAIYDTQTGKIINSAELTDEVEFEIDDFNRKVITEDFNRTVLEEIARDLDPEGDGKTLVYAVDDAHADLIVKILREIYEPIGVSGDAIMKITGSVGGGNRKRVQEAVKRFKNERFPNIAVTVDLLTTGIDVPEITTLVFMRRVKSRILFEQMLGRATRLCPKIQKTHFEIYDPVGLYEVLDPVNTMKPVVQDASARFEDLLRGLQSFVDEEQIKNQIDLIVAKIQRKKRNLSEKAQEQFATISGGVSSTEFSAKLLSLPPQEAKTLALSNEKLFEILEYGTLGKGRRQVISDKPDELVSHTRGYGAGQSPEDYLEEFSDYIKSHINEITALKVICTRPRELTRESLKKLELELDSYNFTEQQLNSAWNTVNNTNIVADIISHIRRGAIGSPLVDHEERIRRAVEKLRRSHRFSKMELGWLSRIEKALLAESIIDRDTFETGAFQSEGGFKRIDKIFNGRLEETLDELNTYLYEGEILA